MSSRSIVSKYEARDAKTYIGTIGEAWIDNDSAALHIGDGTTPGGLPVRGTGNLNVQNDTIGTQDNGEIFLQSGSNNSNYWWAEYGDIKYNFDDTAGDCIAKDSQGNTYQLGLSYVVDGPNPSAIIIKWSPSGEMLWNYVLVETDGYPETYGGGIWIDKNDQIFVCIGLRNEGVPVNFITALDTSANIISSVICVIDSVGSNNFKIWQMTGDNNGYLYVIAQHQYNVGAGTAYCLALMKMPIGPVPSPASVLIGQNNGDELYGYCVNATADSVVVGGMVYDASVSADVMYVAKLDSDLNLLWQRHIGDNSNYASCQAITRDAEGNIYAVGETNGGSLVVKMDANGSQLWQRKIDTNNHGVFTNGAVYDTGSLYLGGVTNDIMSNPGLFVTKLDAEYGMTQWSNSWVSTLADTYSFYYAGLQTLALYEDTLTFAGWTHVGSQPGQQVQYTLATLVNVPKDGTIVDNRFVNFNYIETPYDNVPQTFRNVDVAVTDVTVATNVWIPVDFANFATWNEGPTGEGIFSAQVYQLGSLYEFGTDNNITIPAGGDVVDSNGVSVTGKYYTWTNNNQNTWSITTESGGVEFYYGSTNSKYIWWNPADILGNMQQFRGAIIEYHAYTPEGTTIGKIIWSTNTTGDVQVVETHAGGNVYETFSSYDSTFNGYNALAYNNSANTGTVMIQWTAKMFYGSEWGC